MCVVEGTGVTVVVTGELTMGKTKYNEMRGANT
jgi:hypothetical protein